MSLNEGPLERKGSGRFPWGSRYGVLDAKKLSLYKNQKAVAKGAPEKEVLIADITSISAQSDKDIRFVVMTKQGEELVYRVKGEPARDTWVSNIKALLPKATASAPAADVTASGGDTAMPEGEAKKKGKFKGLMADAKVAAGAGAVVAKKTAGNVKVNSQALAKHTASESVKAAKFAGGRQDELEDEDRLRTANTRRVGDALKGAGKYTVQRATAKKRLRKLNLHQRLYHRKYQYQMRMTLAEYTACLPELEKFVYSNDEKVKNVEQYIKDEVARISKECKEKNINFCDPEFPAGPGMMWVEPEAQKGTMNDDIDIPTEFVRITNLMNFDTPKVFIDNPSADDIDQGAIGTCYLLASLAVLTTVEGALPPLFVASDPDVGVYGLRIYIDGAWKAVIMDDFVPINEYKKVLFAQTVPSELYAILIEKAYAKIHRCYECIDGGIDRYAMSDLTGGTFDSIDIDEVDDPECLAAITVVGLWKGKRTASKNILSRALDTSFHITDKMRAEQNRYNIQNAADMLCCLSFNAGRITGGGDDEGSPYTIEGVIHSVEDGRATVQFTKHYIMRHKVQYVGEFIRSARRMEGRWFLEGMNMQGTWYLTECGYVEEEEEPDASVVERLDNVSKEFFEMRHIINHAAKNAGHTAVNLTQDADEEELDAAQESNARMAVGSAMSKFSSMYDAARTQYYRKDYLPSGIDSLDAFSTIWDMLEAYTDDVGDGVLMSCSIAGEENTKDPRESMGLILNHCYGIVDTVTLSTGTKLVKLRNPLKGDGDLEWTGPWSDRSDLWTPELLGEAGEPDQNAVLDANDGVFHIEFKDFIKAFSTIEMCRIFSGGEWRSRRMEGRWDKKECGGPTYWYRNPQYQLYPTGRGRFAVTLMQPDTKVYLEDDYQVEIGFRIVYTSDETDEIYSLNTLTVAHVEAAPERAVSIELTLDKLGNPFFIIPYTSRPYQRLPFVLSVHSTTDFFLVDPAHADKDSTLPPSGLWVGGMESKKADGMALLIKPDGTISGEASDGYGYYLIHGKHRAGVFMWEKQYIKRTGDKYGAPLRYQARYNMATKELTGKWFRTSTLAGAMKGSEGDMILTLAPSIAERPPSGLWRGGSEIKGMKFTARLRSELVMTIRFNKTGRVHGLGVEQGKFFFVLRGFVKNDGSVSFRKILTGDTELTTNTKSLEESTFLVVYDGTWDPMLSMISVKFNKKNKWMDQVLRLKPMPSSGLFCERTKNRPHSEAWRTMDWFVCKTCSSNVKTCTACALECHKKHTISYIKESLFSCDNCHDCKATSTKPSIVSFGDVVVAAMKDPPEAPLADEDEDEDEDEVVEANDDDLIDPEDDDAEPMPTELFDKEEDGDLDEANDDEGTALVAEVKEKRVCSYETFGELAAIQPWVVCKTCTKAKKLIDVVCGSCAQACHEGHLLVPYKIKKKTPELTCKCDDCLKMGEEPISWVSALDDESVISTEDFFTVTLNTSPYGTAYIALDAVASEGKKYCEIRLVAVRSEIPFVQIGWAVEHPATEESAAAKARFWGVDLARAMKLVDGEETNFGSGVVAENDVWSLKVDFDEKKMVFVRNGRQMTVTVKLPDDFAEQVVPCVHIGQDVTVEFVPYLSHMTHYAKSGQGCDPVLVVPGENAPEDFDHFKQWYLDERQELLESMSTTDDEGEGEDSDSSREDRRSRSRAVRRARNQMVRRARASHVRRSRARLVRRSRCRQVRRAKSRAVRRSKKTQVRRSRSTRVRRAKSRSVRRARNQVARRNRSRIVRGAPSEAVVPNEASKTDATAPPATGAPAPATPGEPTAPPAATAGNASTAAPPATTTATAAEAAGTAPAEAQSSAPPPATASEAGDTQSTAPPPETAPEVPA